MLTLRVLCTMALACLLAGSLGARFFHLDSDFPREITASGEIFTDEGWYTSGAVNKVIEGKWIRDGDFNPIVNLPTFQLAVYGTFKTFGLGLTQARATATIFFIVGVLGFLLLTQRLGVNTPVALLGALILSSDYLGFAYSRRALLEWPMIGLLLVALALAVPPQSPTSEKAEQIQTSHWKLRLLSAWMMATLAILTKSTAIAALPALAIAAMLNFNRRSHRVLALFGFPALTLLGCATYYSFVGMWYENDLNYFWELNVTSRFTSLTSTLADLQRTIHELWAKFSHHGLVIVGIAPWLLAAILRTGSTRILALIGLSWCLGFYLIIGTTNYRPERYLIVFLPGLAMLMCSGMATMIHTVRLKPMAWSLVLLLALWPINQQVPPIAAHLMNPLFTLRHFGRAIEQLASESPAQERAPIRLAGNFADTVALMTGLPAINVNLGVKSFAERVATTPPSLMIELAKDRRGNRALPNSCTSNELAEYQMLKEGRHGLVKVWRVACNSSPEHLSKAHSMNPRSRQ